MEGCPNLACQRCTSQSLSWAEVKEFKLAGKTAELFVQDTFEIEDW